MPSKRTFYFLAAAFALLFGAAIYLMFRPSSLLMFRWGENLGVGDQIAALRTHSLRFTVWIPSWVLFSAPFALWVFSYLLCIKGIWLNSASPMRHIWFWIVPLGSIAVECAQGFALVPGTFDMLDLASIIVLTLFAFILP